MTPSDFHCIYYFVCEESVFYKMFPDSLWKIIVPCLYIMCVHRRLVRSWIDSLRSQLRMCITRSRFDPLDTPPFVFPENLCHEFVFSKIVRLVMFPSFIHQVPAPDFTRCIPRCSATRMIGIPLSSSKVGPSARRALEELRPVVVPRRAEEPIIQR